MKRILLLTSILAFWAFSTTGFKEEQRRYPRVRTAFAEKEAGLTSLLKSKNQSLENLNILIIGLKETEQIEVWANDNNKKKYERILS